MIARSVLSILVWVVGATFGFFTDGQVFRGAAILGCAAVACILLWLPLLRRHEPYVRRRSAIVAVVLNTAIAAVVGVSLPGALKRQRAFNHHLSHAEPPLKEDIDSRRSWALLYFEQNPDADPLQMVGAYNATTLGERLGHFSLDEARAIAAEVARGISK